MSEPCESIGSDEPGGSFGTGGSGEPCESIGSDEPGGSFLGLVGLVSLVILLDLMGMDQQMGLVSLSYGL